MNTFLRFLQFLALTIWVGGIIYLSFVVAPALFTKLPNIDQAGAVVGGIAASAVTIACSCVVVSDDR